MTSALVFDDGLGTLGPLADLRPTFAVRTGALTTLERLAITLHSTANSTVKALWTPEPLVALTREQSALPVNDPSILRGSKGGVLIVNGRCPIAPDELTDLSLGAALIEHGSGHVVAARLASKDAESFLTKGSLPKSAEPRELAGPLLLEWPWDVLRFRDAALDFDLRTLMARESQELPAGVVGIADEQIHIHPDALIYPGVVLDAEQGPIVIDEAATVRPGAIIIGPAYIGPGSTVLDRALIKAHTSIGPVCKVAGEIGGTIFQGFANKAHDGHLGDSWIGEWVNIGAGTTNSNLLNTYADVVAQAEPNGKRVKTGLQFLGCIVGDHVKFAILTRLMTGAVIGTGSMLAAMNPPTAVGRFEWITDDRRQPYRFEKFLEAAKAAMLRRKTAPSRVYTERLRMLAEGAHG